MQLYGGAEWDALQFRIEAIAIAGRASYLHKSRVYPFSARAGATATRDKCEAKWADLHSIFQPTISARVALNDIIYQSSTPHLSK